MASPLIKQASDQNFEQEVLKNKQPVLIDFWATWCAPCRALAPVIDQIADQYAGKLSVYKMDVDQNPGTPGQFGVRGIPTLILFKDGQAVGQLVGSVPKDQIEMLVKKAI